MNRKKPLLRPARINLQLCGEKILLTSCSLGVWSSQFHWPVVSFVPQMGKGAGRKNEIITMIKNMRLQDEQKCSISHVGGMFNFTRIVQIIFCSSLHRKVST